MTMPSLDRRSALAAGLAASGGLLCGAAAAPVPPLPPPATPSPRREIVLDDGWRFHLGHAADPARDFGFGNWNRTYAKPGLNVAAPAAPDFDDRAWEPVRVPHDWATDLPYAPPASNQPNDFVAGHGYRAIGRDFPQNSVGWYRRTLPLSRADKAGAVWLEFDGVFRAALIIVNGFIAHESSGGYAPFGVDIADFLNTDGSPDILVVRVDASLGEGWFYEGAGIYRHVRLVVAAAQHVPQWGVCVRAEPVGTGAHIAAATTIANHADQPATITVSQCVIAPDGATVAAAPAATRTITPGDSIIHDSTLAIDAARRWTLDDPALYRLISEIARDSVVIDRVESRFGIRTIRFDGRRGFFLNDRPVKLLGVCNHQDHAGVGTAIPDALHRWRVARMQDMGANAWRSAHNPPSQALLDACDTMGMLMIAETRLNSTSPEAIDELDRMIRASRNHPSIILWSVGNEEGHQGTPRGRVISARLVARAKALDPTRPTTQAMDSGWMDNGAARAVDVVGFNYRTDRIGMFKAKFPDVPVIGTETASTVATRGEYANDAARHIVRAYDSEHPWWAANAEQWWPIVANDPGIAGGFIWTGFDYRGEPTPYASWPSVSSYFGVVDLCGFAKDNFHYYRAWWRPDLPQVHLLPHWTWPGKDGQPIEVWVHGNAATVELVLNGTSFGVKSMPRNGHLVWSVPYAPGTLRAIGRDARGRVIARDQRMTAGTASALAVSASAARILADGNDLAVIAVEVLDHAGHPVPMAAMALRFAIDGPGRLLGTGNGNPTDTTPDHSPQRHAFNGLAQALVQSTGEPGLIRVRVSGEGLAPAQIDVFAHPA